MSVIFFCTDFFTIFLCIYVCNAKGDAHKQCGPPKREGKLILPRLGKDLAHCGLHVTQLNNPAFLVIEKSTTLRLKQLFGHQLYIRY